MTDHKPALIKAAASWMQLHSLTQAYQAAILRNDVEGAETIRRQAHDVLDVNLDMNAEAATAVRAILGN